MKKLSINDIVPPGFDYRQELRLWGWLCAGAVLYSMGFVFSFMDAVSALYYTDPYTGVKSLQSGAVMADFYELESGRLSILLMLAVLTLLLSAVHYACFFRGSKSIYLMRRLPQRRELARRCLALPLLMALAAAAAAGILLLIYYFVYITFTPRACLAPGQWSKLIHGVTGGWNHA